MPGFLSASSRRRHRQRRLQRRQATVAAMATVTKIINLEDDEEEVIAENRNIESPARSSTKSQPKIELINLDDDDEDDDIIEIIETPKAGPVLSRPSPGEMPPAVSATISSTLPKSPPPPPSLVPVPPKETKCCTAIPTTISEASSSKGPKPSCLASSASCTPTPDAMLRSYDPFAILGDFSNAHLRRLLPDTSPFLSSTAPLEIDDEDDAFTLKEPPPQALSPSDTFEFDLTDETIVDYLDSLMTETPESAANFEKFKASSFGEILADLIRSPANEPLPLLSESDLSCAFNGAFPISSIPGNVQSTAGPLTSSSQGAIKRPATSPLATVSDYNDYHHLESGLSPVKRPKMDAPSTSSWTVTLRRDTTESSASTDTVDTLSSVSSTARTTKRRLYETLSLSCTVPGCGATVDTQAALDAHYVADHALPKNRCLVDGCGRGFLKRGELTHHYEVAHVNGTNTDPSVPLWKCVDCAYEAPNIRRLTAHHKEIHLLGAFQCAFEGCTYPVANNLADIRKHGRSAAHAIRRPAKYRCCHPAASCPGPKTFDSVEERAAHYLLVHPKGERKGTATPKQQQQQTPLALEYKNLQVALLPQPALHLLKPAMNPPTGQQHQPQPQPASHVPKKYTCTAPNCTRTYNDKRNYQKHLNGHEGFSSYKCPLEDCAFTTVYEASIYKHMEKEHDTELRIIEKLPPRPAGATRS